LGLELAIPLVIALSVACGYVGGMVRSLVLHRRTQGLEYRLQDLEVRNLTVKNREKAQRRWDKEETMEEEFAALGLKPGEQLPDQRKKFDNDPLG